MKLVDGFKAWLEAQYSCPVIIEPQKQDRPDPRWRLAIGNFETQGINRRILNIKGSIQADGDGPTYLEKLLELSEKSSALELTEKGFEFEYTLPGGTYIAKASFSLLAEGAWQENDPEEKFTYSYVEPYRIQLSYNPNNT